MGTNRDRETEVVSMSLNLNPFETVVFPKRRNPIKPEPTFEILDESFRYPSSIDTIPNLFAGVAYMDDRQPKPNSRQPKQDI